VSLVHKIIVALYRAQGDAESDEQVTLALAVGPQVSCRTRGPRRPRETRGPPHMTRGCHASIGICRGPLLYAMALGQAQLLRLSEIAIPRDPF
jgi:hypothetical protein